jgi:hypothetical protein
MCFVYISQILLNSKFTLGNDSYTQKALYPPEGCLQSLTVAGSIYDRPYFTEVLSTSARSSHTIVVRL